MSCMLKLSRFWLENVCASSFQCFTISSTGDFICVICIDSSDFCPLWACRSGCIHGPLTYQCFAAPSFSLNGRIFRTIYFVILICICCSSWLGCTPMLVEYLLCWEAGTYNTKHFCISSSHNIESGAGTCMVSVAGDVSISLVFQFRLLDVLQRLYTIWSSQLIIIISCWIIIITQLSGVARLVSVFYETMGGFPIVEFI